MYHKIDSPGNALNNDIMFATKDYPNFIFKFLFINAYKTQTQ